MDAIIGLALIRPEIEIGNSGWIRLILSLTDLSNLKAPILKAVVATNSPTHLTRLFANESMSSIPSLFWASLIKKLIVPIISSTVKIFVSKSGA